MSGNTDITSYMQGSVLDKLHYLYEAIILLDVFDQTAFDGYADDVWRSDEFDNILDKVAIILIANEKQCHDYHIWDDERIGIRSKLKNNRLVPENPETVYIEFIQFLKSKLANTDLFYDPVHEKKDYSIEKFEEVVNTAS